MPTYSKEEVERLLDTNNPHSAESYDEEGQIIVQTGLYKWKDKTYHTEPDPIYNEEMKADLESWQNEMNEISRNYLKDRSTKNKSAVGVSRAWVLSELAGMKFPEQGQAYEYMKKLMDKF